MEEIHYGPGENSLFTKTVVSIHAFLTCLLALRFYPRSMLAISLLLAPVACVHSVAHQQCSSVPRVRASGPALHIKPLQPSSQSDTTPVSSKAASSSSSTPSPTTLITPIGIPPPAISSSASFQTTSSDFQKDLEGPSLTGTRRRLHFQAEPAQHRVRSELEDIAPTAAHLDDEPESSSHIAPPLLYRRCVQLCHPHDRRLSLMSIFTMQLRKIPACLIIIFPLLCLNYTCANCLVIS
ncbi:hypothetical protein NC652_037627 [Populus alba x Populus x berolinensis]|nr:hypothetical protein NC652_037627 [Populus alba x Populus x berolinensis]